MFRFSSLITVLLLLSGTACMQRPEAPPKSDIERAAESIRPPEVSELDTGSDEDKTTYSVLERGRAEAFRKEASKPAQPIPPAVKKKVEGDFPLLNLEDASLWEVIKIVADYQGWNYVIDPTVPDKGINVRLNEAIKGMDVENVLHLLLSIYSVAMVEHDGLVYFVPAKGADYKLGADNYVGNRGAGIERGQGWVTQIIPLHFVTPEEMSPILKEFVSASGKIIEDPVTSVVVVIDRLPFVNKVLDVVSMFDVNVFQNKKLVLIRFENASATVVQENIVGILEGYSKSLADKVYLAPIKELNALLCISSVQEIIEEVKFWADKFEHESEVGESQIFVYHVENVAAADLAGIIEEIYAEDHAASKNKEGQVEMRPVLQSNFNVITDEGNNSLIFKTTRRDYNIIERTLRQLDQPKKQVLIEAMILDLSLSGSLSYGFNWFIKHDTSLGHAPGFDFVPGDDGNAFAGSYNFLFDTFQLESILNANEIKSRTNVLSTPHIMVLDNEQASIDVGQQISIQTGNVSVPSATQTQNTGFYNSSSYQYLSTGVKLQVKPTISSNGTVRMEINQSYSVPGSGGGSGGNPPINNRAAQTIINVPDGKSVLIGGMIQETYTNSDNRVPVLGHIPLLKYFFMNKSVTKEKSELIIIITPHVMYQTDDAVTITKEFRKEIDAFRKEVSGSFGR